MKRISFDHIVKAFAEMGLKVLTPSSEYTKNSKQKLVIADGRYKAMKSYNQICSDRKYMPSWFHKKNPFTIYNINQYLLSEKNGDFICTSSEFIDRNNLLDFECVRCNTFFGLSWFNAYRHCNDSHRGITCPNCDGHIESIHALVLKQIFCHEIPDTIIEEKVVSIH